MITTNVNNYLKGNGFLLSQLIPGKNEYALNEEKSKQFIKLLQSEGVEVIGGDILVKDGDRFGYSHQVWGSQYHYVSWSNECESDGGYKLALKSIEAAQSISKSLGGEIMVSFIL